MKLVGIEFHGFKSFADSAQIRFHDGITAIVGPNGCGKSNISDGLRWVLGEQKPTAIRGSRMEEAIFQGTQKRKAIQRAEVILKLSNEDHIMPVPFADVQISRTVNMGGDGEYRLNGSLCRLRDIQDLCRDTGLGTNAYAIIEQRMIDAILSDRAEERRAMFEEAAGIGRYKERRRIAARRLDEADADLARVDDLISEVQTKVRSLARQRGRARRFLEMRERKIAVELALAQAELERLRVRREEIETELRTLTEANVRDSTLLRSTEAEHEKLRVQLSDLERERSEGGLKLMTVRDRLAERERERLLTEERARHARNRLEQIARDRDELLQQKREIEAHLTKLEVDVGERSAKLSSIRESLEGKEVGLAEIARTKQKLEAAEAAVESERESYREQRAQLLARRDAARAEAKELARRIADAEGRLTSLSAVLEEREGAAQRARAAATTAADRLRQIETELEQARARASAVQTKHEALRGEQAALAERIHAAAARIEALIPLTRGEEGLSPAVQAALAEATELGIHGVLGRSIEVAEPFAEAVEAYLGPFMEGLLVDDEAAVDRIRLWFTDEYQGQGGLVVLPASRLPAGTAAAPELPQIKADHIGTLWLKHLLRGATLAQTPPGGSGAWIGSRESLDSLGVTRLGQPSSGGGTLARRAELDRLQSQREHLEGEAGRLRERLESLADQTAAETAAVDELKASYRLAEEEGGRLAARAEAAAERLARTQEEVESARPILVALGDDRERALQRAAAEEQALGSLKPVGAEEAPEFEELAAVRAEWERRREEVTDLRLRETKAASELEAAQRDRRSGQESLAGLTGRLKRLEGEAEELQTGLADADEEIEKASAQLEGMFKERTEAEHASRKLEERAEEVRKKVAELELRLRKVQQHERAQSEHRHELELERSQLDADLTRARERLENEWGRSFEELVDEVEPAEGEAEELERELSRIAEQLGQIGLVNMLAEQEYQEQRERLEFLQGQRDDLAKARDDLRETIRQINETASAAFLETLNQVRENFKGTFTTLFQGGECDVWLEDAEDPLDSPIEISASPGGKRTQRIHLLSGGERALTALSLLFAIYFVKPSPFCILDEVDAPLDETNIRRFVEMLERFKGSVQFIVITHNPVTIEAADWIYGVTMEEPGVSKIVGVEFSEYARGAVA